MVGWVFGNLFTTEKITILSRIPKTAPKQNGLSDSLQPSREFLHRGRLFQPWDICLNKHLKYVFGSDIRRVRVVKSVIEFFLQGECLLILSIGRIN